MAAIRGMVPGLYAKQKAQRQKLNEDTKPMIQKLPKGGAGPAKGKAAQPGPGAPTGGTGRDTPQAGKERGQFEQDRQRERGTGNDRPPVYTPKDDGERGGYINRSTPTGSVGVGRTLSKTKGLPVIDRRTVKQKLKDASSRR